MNLVLVALFVGIGLVLGTLALGGYLAAPWVPLWRRDIRRMLATAEVKAGDEVHDLGAGDGRMLFMAAREYGARGVGYEIAILPFAVSWGILLLRGPWGKIRFRYANFFSADLRTADVVTLFLMPKALEKLRPKFEQELKPGCRVVSYAFSIPGWQPTKINKPKPNLASVFLYVR